MHNIINLVRERTESLISKLSGDVTKYCVGTVSNRIVRLRDTLNYTGIDSGLPYQVGVKGVNVHGNLFTVHRDQQI